MADAIEEFGSFIADGKRTSDRQNVDLTDPSTVQTQIIGFEGIARITDNTIAVLDRPTGSGFLIGSTKVNSLLGAGSSSDYVLRRSSSNVFEIQQDFEQGSWDVNITLTNGDIRLVD